MARSTPYKWQFKSRLRRHAFGWRSSRLAARRVKEAVSEVKKVARRDPMLAADGAVGLIERISPALEQVDSSSGALGAAVNDALEALVPLIAGAPADEKTRAAWLDRLFEAHGADEMPFIESLAEFWGKLCGSPETASAWADELLHVTRQVIGGGRNPGDHFHGATACLSALLRAQRFDEIIDVLEAEKFWPYQKWKVRALAAMGRSSEAIQYAEECRDPWASDLQIDMTCEEILLASGFGEDAYTRYGLRANRRGTYLATFRAVSKKYPQKTPAEILDDLVETTPGEEGKWFAAAKQAGLYDEALVLARQSPCDPKTLARAARDLAGDRPDFAVEAGVLALTRLVEGYGYEITSLDVLESYNWTMQAAALHGDTEGVKERIRAIVATERGEERFVTRVLARELGFEDA